MYFSNGVGKGIFLWRVIWDLVICSSSRAVGKVALTGRHSWVCAHELNSKFVPEVRYPTLENSPKKKSYCFSAANWNKYYKWCGFFHLQYPDEWHLQFAFGVKVIQLRFFLWGQDWLWLPYACSGNTWLHV